MLVLAIPQGFECVKVTHCFAQLVEVVSEYTRPSSLNCRCQIHNTLPNNLFKAQYRRQSSVQQLPECLAVQLMRNITGQSHVKNHTRVQVSLDPLDLSCLTVVREREPEPATYVLYGARVQSNNMGVDSGHFYCYSMSDDGKWFLMDDQLVREVNMVQELRKKEVEENIHVLLYRKT